MGLFFSIFFGITLAIVTAYLIITKFEQTISFLVLSVYYFLVALFWIVPPLIIFFIIQVWSLPMLFLSFIIWILVVRIYPKIEKILNFDLFSIFKKSKS